MKEGRREDVGDEKGRKDGAAVRWPLLELYRAGKRRGTSVSRLKRPRQVVAPVWAFLSRRGNDVCEFCEALKACKIFGSEINEPYFFGVQLYNIPKNLESTNFYVKVLKHTLW